jgi:hypothetical protein
MFRSGHSEVRHRVCRSHDRWVSHCLRAGRPFDTTALVGAGFGKLAAITLALLAFGLYEMKHHVNTRAGDSGESGPAITGLSHAAPEGSS